MNPGQTTRPLEHNKAIVRRYQDAYNSNDFAALAEVVTEDVLTPNIEDLFSDSATCRQCWRLC